VSADEALAAVNGVRPLMLASAPPRRLVYERAGRSCVRCSQKVRARGMGDDNRTVYWCPGCQR